jgi:trimeric autotransporter adhesin
MKKIIKKFWGVGLIVIMLSTLFVAATPVAAGDYALGNSFAIPTGLFGNTTISAAAGFGILDVAQSDTTIYATATDTAGTDYLYKSTTGGATWAPAVGTGLPAGVWGIVAVAPDDANIVVVVNTAPALADTVWLSTNGGAVFQQLTAAGAADLNDVAISASAGVRYIAIGGHTAAVAEPTGGGYLAHWTMGLLVTGWVAIAGLPACDDVESLAYSPNFVGDQALMAVTETFAAAAGAVAGDVSLHTYSYNTALWDIAVDVSFPRVLESTAIGTTLACARADLILDTNFSLDQEELQIGFIGASITTTAAAELGGVYRIGTYTVVGAVYNMTQIMTGTAINSVAWDGTNVMAAQLGAFPAGIPIWRSATALSAFPVFNKNSTLKTPGTGNGGLVLFNGETGYAFSQGNNGGIARTTDFGKSFNGIALIASTTAIQFGTITDAWISPDGATKYIVADDGVDINIWRQSGFISERIAILATLTGQIWLVRADADAPSAVYIGRQTAKTMYKSTDSGDFTWTARSCSQNIQDFVVQDATTVYVAANAAALVVKTINAGFTWSNPPTAVPFGVGGGTCYSITLLSSDHLIIGGTTGGVAYTKDGTTWTGMLNAGPGTIVTAANGLETGNSVFAASSGATGAIVRWTFGTNVVAWTPGQAIAGAVNVGIALSNGVLYVLDDAGNDFYRLLHPTIDLTGVAVTGTETFVEAGAYTQGVNKLSASAAGTTSTVWAVNAAALDTLDSFTDYLTSASNAPALVYPLAGDKIAVNSINGIVAGFIFKWNAPTVVPVAGPSLYGYNLEVYLDEAGTIAIAGSPVVSVLGAGTPAPSLSIGSAAGTVAFNLVAVPGETYYWRVRVDQNTPAASYWSAMNSFSIQQTLAIVPTIASPSNGASGISTKPSFSWSPVAGTTKYEFQLSDTTNFDIAMFTQETVYTGIQPNITLEAGKTYFWRVRALEPAAGDWSTVANFTVAVPVPPPVTPTITVAPTPTITIVQPPVTVIIPTQTTAPVEKISPAYIWAIIIIGAVLVIAVIVLIVRTRRTV